MEQLKIILEDRLADLLEHQTIDKRDFVPLVLADIAQGTAIPAEDRYSLKCSPCMNRGTAQCLGCKWHTEPDKVKPLAQYLDECIQRSILVVGDYSLQPLLEQALDAYQSTENVTIKIERKT